jgi:cytochrome P450
MTTTFPEGPRSVLPGGVFLGPPRDFLGFLETTFARHGDFAHWRMGPFHTYLLAHPDDVHAVLVRDAAGFTKGPALRSAKATLGEGLLTSDGELHRRPRKLIQPLFHAKKVDAYAETFVGFAGRAGARWRAGETVDLNVEMTRLTLEVVTKVLFDTDIEPEVRQIGRDMQVVVTMFDRVRNPLAPLLNRVPFLPSNRRYVRAFDRIRGVIDRLIADRRARPTERMDLLSLLLSARVDASEVEGDAAHGGGGKGAVALTDKQVRDHAITLFMAGHETTANALVWTFYLLSRHPEADARLGGELRAVLDGRAATAEDVDRLPYARAVLAESMRLYPPAWVVARQTARPYTIRGHTAPANSIFMMSQWVTHRDARWWPDPLAFKPERWLGAPPAGRPRLAYFPFGSGPRACIGESFAWLEAGLILATLARDWRMEYLLPGEPRLHGTITLRPQHAMPMRLVGR